MEEKFGFEKDPESLSAVISIENLTKVFFNSSSCSRVFYKNIQKEIQNWARLQREDRGRQHVYQILRESNNWLSW